jgi:signal transduction histidine kinase
MRNDVMPVEAEARPQERTSALKAQPAARGVSPDATREPAARITPPSIRQRLSRVVMIGSLACAAAVSVSVWLAAQEEVDELLDDTLRSSSDLMGSLLQRASLPAPLVGGAMAPSPRFVWQVVSGEGRVEAGSAGAPGEPLSAEPRGGFFDTPELRVYGSALGPGGRMLYVAQTRSERSEAQFEVALSSALAALAVTLVGYFWLRARLGQELSPVQRLSARLAEHEPLSLGASLGDAERAEFQSVHNAIDQLLQRLSKRLAQERAFTAHAAHALRTPLAGIDAQLALCLRESPVAVHPRLQRAREAARRLQHVVAALLTLFRGDVEPEREAVDMAQLLRQFPLERLQVNVDATHPIEADADLLAAALVNLLDNAQRYGASRVEVSTPAPHIVRLDDDGPGVAAERRLALTAALNAQAYDGVPGLGLTLADLVARAHGGRLALPAAAAGRGFAVELSLRTTTA